MRWPPLLYLVDRYVCTCASNNIYFYIKWFMISIDILIIKLNNGSIRVCTWTFWSASFPSVILYIMWLLYNWYLCHGYFSYYTMCFLHITYTRIILIVVSIISECIIGKTFVYLLQLLAGIITQEGFFFICIKTWIQIKINNYNTILMIF